MPDNALLTYADLEAMFPVDNVRRELIGGELIVSPSPFVRHQTMVLRLVVAFHAHILGHGGGTVLPAPMDVILSERDVVQPDIVFIADDRSEIVQDRIRGVPSLVIEVLSDARYDKIRKRDLYARYSIPEYWIVDPDGDRVEVYRHEGTGYPKPEIFEPGETVTYEKLPGLSIDVTTLFAP